MKTIIYSGDDWITRVRTALQCTDCDLLPRVENAGGIIQHDGENCQVMHNGVLVLRDCYYNYWLTEIIRYLKGHHEPQEERVFAEVLPQLPAGAVMMELGAYWAYYSLWFQSAVEGGVSVMVEPDRDFLEVGLRNFALNDRQGRFIHGAISDRAGRLAGVETDMEGPLVPTVTVDGLMQELGLARIDLLHCDVQGHELAMLRGAHQALAGLRIGYVFISTHSDTDLHRPVMDVLLGYGYRIIAEHNMRESFSFDGLVVAAAPSLDQPQEVHISRRG